MTTTDHVKVLVHPVSTLEAAADQWAQRRLTLLESVLPGDLAAMMAAGLEQAAAGVRGGWPSPGVFYRDLPAGEERLDVLDGGGAYRHVQIDRYGVERNAPELVGLYHGLRMTLEAITGGEVLESPWLRSSVNVKVLLDAGDGQGWHYDTNSLTALLYLTDTTEETGTRVMLGEDADTMAAVVARAGDLLVMDGRHLWHRVPEHPGGTRITCPLNYYLPGDTDRPAGIDTLVYGSEQG